MFDVNDQLLKAIFTFFIEYKKKERNFVIII